MVCMAEVEIGALEQDVSAVVQSVAAGETVTITLNGRPAAQMTPVPSSRLDALLASGQARPARRSIADMPAPARWAGIVRGAVRHAR